MVLQISFDVAVRLLKRRGYIARNEKWNDFNLGWWDSIPDRLIPADSACEGKVEQLAEKIPTRRVPIIFKIQVGSSVNAVATCDNKRSIIKVNACDRSLLCASRSLEIKLIADKTKPSLLKWLSIVNYGCLTKKKRTFSTDRSANVIHNYTITNMSGTFSRDSKLSVLWQCLIYGIRIGLSIRVSLSRLRLVFLNFFFIFMNGFSS